MSALEEELYGFTTHGFMGDHSPNRADAMIWGISDLFPSMLANQKSSEEKAAVPTLQRPRSDGLGWMNA